MAVAEAIQEFKPENAGEHRKGDSSILAKILLKTDWKLKLDARQLRLKFKDSGSLNVTGGGDNKQWTWIVIADRFLILDHQDEDFSVYDFKERKKLAVMGRTYRAGRDWHLSPMD